MVFHRFLIGFCGKDLVQVQLRLRQWADAVSSWEASGRGNLPGVAADLPGDTRIYEVNADLW